MDSVSALRWIALGVAVLFNAGANILIKMGARATGSGLELDQAWRLALEPTVLGGIASFGLALAFYAYALTEIELSVGYPILTSLGLVIVFVWSVTFFQETLDPPKILGTLAVLVGVVLLAISG